MERTFHSRALMCLEFLKIKISRMPNGLKDRQTLSETFNQWFMLRNTHNLSNGFEWSIIMTNVFLFLKKNESSIAQIASFGILKWNAMQTPGEPLNLSFFAYISCLEFHTVLIDSGEFFPFSTFHFPANADIWSWSLKNNIHNQIFSMKHEA